MIDRIPRGTRDVLPDEMRELRAMTDRIHTVFEHAGYGEVSTPALEYEGTFGRSDAAGGRPAYRVFDEQGNVLILRTDMTVPIARLVATRYGAAAPQTSMSMSLKSSPSSGHQSSVSPMPASLRRRGEQGYGEVAQHLRCLRAALR